MRSLYKSDRSHNWLRRFDFLRLVSIAALIALKLKFPLLELLYFKAVLKTNWVISNFCQNQYLHKYVTMSSPTCLALMRHVLCNRACATAVGVEEHLTKELRATEFGSLKVQGLRLRGISRLLILKELKQINFVYRFLDLAFQTFKL